MGLKPDAAHHYGFDFAPPILSKNHFAEGGDRGVATLTNQAMEFIARNRERPWFCFLSHHMIHGKVVAPEALTQKYRDQGYGDAGPNRAVYLAGLECIDRSIGRLMERLDDLSLTKNTLVIFLSDNGGIHQKLDFKKLPNPHPTSPVFPVEIEEYDNAPLRAGKGSIYEGGVRVPMIVRWPNRIPSSLVIETPVHAIDVLPTCFEAAGAQAPSAHILDGENLIPTMANADQSLADRPIFQYYPFYDLRWGLTPSASIRLGDYKLIEFFGDRVDDDHRYVGEHRLELYHLRRDIGENENLAEKEPDLANQLAVRLHRWMRSVGAERSVTNSHFDPSRAFFETREKPERLKDVRWNTVR